MPRSDSAAFASTSFGRAKDKDFRKRTWRLPSSRRPCALGPRAGIASVTEDPDDAVCRLGIKGWSFLSDHDVLKNLDAASLPQHPEPLVLRTGRRGHVPPRNLLPMPRKAS